MTSNSRNYYIIFDTNVLHKSYKNKVNFRDFSLNTEYESIIELVNQMDIYESVGIIIADVVWTELKKQIVEAHDKYIRELEKWQFPEYDIKPLPMENYSEYIENKMKKYREDISNGLNKIIEMPIPNDKHFSRIVTRAFEKEAPFEGKEKSSDKGFKDALLWESILELTESDTTANIIFYSQDKGFKEQLIEEFEQLYPEASINIFGKREDVERQLQIWAKEIDEYSYLPNQKFDADNEFDKWVNSADFTMQLFDGKFNIVNQSEPVSSTSINLIKYEDLEIKSNDDNITLYSFEALLNISYVFNNGVCTKKTVGVHVEAECDNLDEYSINSVFIIDPRDSEDEERLYVR